MSKELWLETGTIQGKNYQDMHWYNEGRWQELPHWLKYLGRRLILRRPTYKMYFLIRYGKAKLRLHI